jgi:hypothetical protein
MDFIKSSIGRRRFLIAGGAVSALALARKAEAAEHTACGANQPATIKGLAVEKPVHPPYKWSGQTLREMTAPAAGASAAIPGAASALAPAKATPAIYIGDSKYLAEKSQASVVGEGKVNDRFAMDAKISGGSADIGGVYAMGMGTEYILANANIELSGDGSGLGGPNGGGVADDHATLIIKNCTITTNGQNRNATSAQNYSTLKVYNSTLKANGVPFTVDFTKGGVSSGQKTQMEVDGNCRGHVTLSNSSSYFYYSTIIAGGWGALSTDISDGFVYLEANHCTVKTLTSGYGTYADPGCHGVFNHCDLDVAAMAAIIAGEGDVTFNDTKAKCASYFALIHNIASATDVGTLKVTGGEIATQKAVIRVKSANCEIMLDGARIRSANGILLESLVSVDPNAAKAAKTKGMNVYGIHATLKNMDLEGDVVHAGDKENRGMTIYLEQTTLKGAIKDASLKMNRLSKWFATKDSNVTIIGDVEVSQIDAPAGVTITAIAAQSGTYKLASCGTLVLKTA